MGVAAAFFLTALIVPVYGRHNTGKDWMLPVILAAIPSVYGGTLGFGLPGRAPWRILFLGGALTPLTLLFGSPVSVFLQCLAAATIAPAPAAAVSGYIARRAALSPNARVWAALLLALGVVALFAFADYLKWVPQIGIICEWPVPGFGPN